MNTRLDEPTATGDAVVQGTLVLTLTITILGVLALIRAAVGGGVDHVTVRVDNRAGLAVQVDALDASGDRVGLGEAEPGALTTFHEIPDIGPWSARTAARRFTARPSPDPSWPSATGRSRSPPARPPPSSGRDSSDHAQRSS